MSRDNAISIPAADKFWITQALIPSVFLRDKCDGASVDQEGSALVDLRVEGDKLAAIAPATGPQNSDTPSVDLRGLHVWPALVDMHTHIDKSQVISRIGPLGASFANAREAINADRLKHWNRDDIWARMDFSIRSAFAHGICALRTHIDSYEGQAEPSWQVFAELRQAWKGRVTLQATSSVPIDVYTTAYGKKLADLAAATEGGLLGGVLRRSTDHSYTFIDNIDELLDAQFVLAKDRNLPVDLHVDETTESNVFHLEQVAKAVIKHKMQGRVVCGHCCSLAVQAENKIKAVLALCAEAGIGIVTLPAANLYLQDRQLGRTPRLRGVTALHEIRANHIPIAIASDNVRDSFYPFGDYDPVETFRQAVALYHLDQALGESLDMLGPLPAQMMGITPQGSLNINGQASLIVVQARSLNEIVCRPQTDRIVVMNGRELRDALPEFPASVEP
jgi:cytosine/creatinine deaminase